MKVNGYFLIVGILTIISGFTHALNGHATLLPLIDASDFEITAKTTVFYIWHIITVENLIFGIAFVLMAFNKFQSKTNFAAWLILAILIARWAVIFGTTLVKDIHTVQNTVVDSFAIILLIGLILLGIRKAVSGEEEMGKRG